MANLNMAFYDYDGVLYAFGVVSGLSDVSYVRMYVSTGTGTTYQYRSDEIYDKDTAKINTIQNSTPCFVFNVRTDRDYKDGSTEYPQRLNYWILDENEDGYGRYKVSFHFYDSSGNLLNSDPLRPNAGGYSNVYFQMHNSLDSPDIEYDATNKKLRVYNAGKYRHIVEIVRKNRKSMSYDSDTRDYAYTVLMKNFEGGKYWEPIPDTSMIGETDGETNALCRFFEYYDVKALILFDSGVSFTTTEKENCIAYATDALNSLSELTGITVSSIDTLVSSNYDKYDCRETSLMQNDTWGHNAYANDLIEYEDVYRIFVRFGKAGSMAASDFGGQGRWFTTQWADYANGGTATCHAMIQIDAAKTYETLNHVVHEEIYQSLGIGGDNYYYINSIHADPEYCNPDEYIGIDKDILKFIYSSVWSGWDSFDFINRLDTPCILFADYTGAEYYEFDLTKLDDDDYIAYAWIAGEKSNPGEVGTSKSTNTTLEAGGTSEFQYWDGGWDDSPYSLKNSIEFTHRASEKPEKWYWSTRYTDTNGNIVDITSNAYVPMDAEGIHPVTYLEWNNFTTRINEFRNYAGYSDYNFTTVTRYQDFTPAIYNEAVKAIKGVPGYGSYVYEISNVTELSAALFNSLASEANAIAGYV